MPDYIRKSIFTKIAAVGFIYLILLANYWFGSTISGDPAPGYVYYMFYAGVFVVFLSFFGIAYLVGQRLLSSSDVRDSQTEDKYEER
ncbi:MAG: hypothetical protein HRU19_08235 [Pseudobacteriovorax sp.]|nr:hypothetical protein [Pseudobacteriovorax sp.]